MAVVRPHALVIIARIAVLGISMALGRGDGVSQRGAPLQSPEGGGQLSLTTAITL